MGDLIRRRDWIRATWWMWPCDVWPGPVNNHGYGMRRRDKGTQLVHRQAWIDIFGMPVEPRPWVLHACDNPPCRQMHHLWDGNNSDNLRDAVEKGRHFSPQWLVTHCPAGHAYTEDNLVPWFLIHKNERKCLTCFRAADRERKRVARRARGAPMRNWTLPPS